MLHVRNPLLCLDADEGGSGGGVVDAATDDTASHPDTASQSDPGQAGTGWSGPSEEEWYALQGMLQNLAQSGRLQAAQTAQAAAQDPSERFTWDPLAEDAGEQLLNLLSQRDEYLLNRFQEMLSPVVAHTREELESEAEERAFDILADIEASEGKFKGGEEGRKIARVLADSFFPEAAARFGGPGTPGAVRSAEYALRKAAQKVREYEERVATIAVNEFKASLEGIAGASNEPGAGTTGAGEVSAGADTEKEAVARLFGQTVSV